MNNNSKNLELKEKGKKALHRLGAINDGLEEINPLLSKAAEVLEDIINDKDILKNFNVKSEIIKLKDTKKQRSMIMEKPERIEFKLNRLVFYIDFTLVPSESDDVIYINGSIIYGTNRTLCFTDCIFPEKNKKNNNCENCERIDRCDRLEDKPLIQFSVYRSGQIKNSELDDEWWIKKSNEEKNKQNLIDMHYRALAHIWKDALDWTNEKILP